MAFTIIRQDLARIEADAIVVPANEHLQITGGTVLAVAEAAGRRRLQHACNKLGGCAVGQAVATPGFKLPAAHIIHAVGPIWQGGEADEERLLRSAYDNALRLALRLNARTVALPLLSTGAFGYPVRPAFEIAIQAIREFLEYADMDVLLVVYDKRAVVEGSRLVGEIAEYIDDAEVDRSRWERQHLRCLADNVECGSVPQVAGAALAADEAPARLCGVCGAPLPDLGRFCPRCGTRMDAGRSNLSLEMRGYPQERRAAPDAATGYAHVEARVPKSGGRKVRGPRASRDDARSRASGGVGSAPAEKAPDLGYLLANMDEGFSVMLMRLIDARGLTDAQVYKRANITRQHFSKMRKPGYRPTKRTVLALAVALRLTLPETVDLLARAGFALSPSEKSDIIVEYFISQGIYDIFAINEALFSYDQPLLG